jgi:D-glycero-beta-D-manno-heptose 1-phosphate adenylyltransferase
VNGAWPATESFAEVRRAAISRKDVLPLVKEVPFRTIRRGAPSLNHCQPAGRGQNVGVNFRDKIIAWDQLPEWRQKVRATGRKLVVTNGCFDILHVGHVTYLETARHFGDALLVGVNGDAAVRDLKGKGRPVNSETDRAAVLAALESVSGICLFPEKTMVRFLAAAQPDIYVKGGDYTLDTLNQDERRAVEAAGGIIKIIPFVPGKSTTALLKKISQL